MSYSSIQDALDAFNSLSIVDILYKTGATSQHFFGIAGVFYAAFPIKINRHFELQGNAVDVSTQDTTGTKNSIGKIIKPHKIDTSLPGYSEYSFIAFIEEYRTSLGILEEFITAQDFHIYEYYILVEEQYLQDYIQKYKNSSVVWGGFYHTDNKKINEPIPKNVTEFICKEQIEIPTAFHHYSAQKAIHQPFAFERFLKNYHLLELLFDYQTIQKIISCQSSTLGDIEKQQKSVEHLKAYAKEKTEAQKLETFLNEKIASVTNIEVMLQSLPSLTPYANLAKELFFDSCNPPDKLSDKFLTDPSYFASLPPPTKPQKIKIAACHCIYRVRCCIAHNKIGEYALYSEEHERFVVEFAEPLLQEVLIQCFTNIP